MSRKKSSAANPWNAILHYKKELMKRDPLGMELTNVLLELYLTPPQGEALVALINRCGHLKTQLSEKYEVDDIYVPDPVHWDAWQHSGCSRAQIEELAWWPVSPTRPLSLTTNWLLSNEVRLVLNEHTQRAEIITPESEAGRQPPKGENPVLILTVDLARVNLWDLNRLSKALTDAVKEALMSLKGVPEQSWGSLQFLEHVSPQVFEQDLRRFNLHMIQAWSFRDIAFIEWMEMQDPTKEKRLRKRPTGIPIPRESTIRESVSRIHKAIYHKPYRARRRRIDAPAQGIPVYHCPLHGDGSACSQHQECEYRTSWWKNTNPTLANDHTGSIRATSLEDVENIEDPSELPSDTEDSEITAS